ncbi:unnamed protein product [Amoebophrya sp. A120]|nr:unnamed protein product [Amoebophrya sp. A120]|eukprot:GSA120T00025852001.1
MMKTNGALADRTRTAEERQRHVRKDEASGKIRKTKLKAASRLHEANEELEAALNAKKVATDDYGAVLNQKHAEKELEMKNFDFQIKEIENRKRAGLKAAEEAVATAYKKVREEEEEVENLRDMLTFTENAVGMNNNRPIGAGTKVNLDKIPEQKELHTNSATMVPHGKTTFSSHSYNGHSSNFAQAGAHHTGTSSASGFGGNKKYGGIQSSPPKGHNFSSISEYHAWTMKQHQHPQVQLIGAKKEPIAEKSGFLSKIQKRIFGSKPAAGNGMTLDSGATMNLSDEAGRPLSKGQILPPHIKTKFLMLDLSTQKRLVLLETTADPYPT